jgi:hypothetical protein
MGILGLLGGGGGLGLASTTQAGPSTASGATVNVQSGSNVVIYVIIGVLGFLALIALMIWLRKNK